MADKCTGLAIVGKQCILPAKWENQNGVRVCNYHRLTLDAFTWTGKEKDWKELEAPVSSQ